jgi:beta-xylosidase
MVDWPIVSHVFTRDYRHPWATRDFWAPEIHNVDGRFVVYYAARHRDGMLCVGAAISKEVTGPYTDVGSPLIHNVSVGMIDPHYFKDPLSGKSYLFWKEDANGLNPPKNYTPIWVRQLTSDGLHFVGTQVMVLQNDPTSWEGGLVEAPWVVYLSDWGFYYLFYSANVFDTPHYAIGVAKSKNLLGPYVKYPSNPIIHSNEHWSGPGHCSVLPTVASSSLTRELKSSTDSRARWFLLYHSYNSTECGPQYPRTLVMDALFFDENGWPYVRGNAPSFGKTPIPGTEQHSRFNG